MVRSYSTVVVLYCIGIGIGIGTDFCHSFAYNSTQKKTSAERYEMPLSAVCFMVTV